MTDSKLETLLVVAEEKSFTKAAERLSLTQPAVSHHISQLERELGAKLFIRKNGGLMLTGEGEIAEKYARRLKAMSEKMVREIRDSENHLKRLRVGITHTSESNFAAEVLAKYSSLDPDLSVTIITDTIKNLYEMLENFEIDLAIVEGKINNPDMCSLMLDTDYLVCAMSNGHRLAKNSTVKLSALKREEMILRLPTSATRQLFESVLDSCNESIDDFNIKLEVDNIATIKTLIRKDLGVSILPKSACLRELKKGKMTALPIENLSMVRETNLVYHKTFRHLDVLQNIAKLYKKTSEKY